MEAALEKHGANLSLLVVHQGRIAYERYAPGVDRFGHWVMSSQIYTNARDRFYGG